VHDVNEAVGFTRSGTRNGAVPNAGGMRMACSVCSQVFEQADDSSSPGKPGLTCGLCGAVIVLSGTDRPPCQSCGEPIRSGADAVKLCDGRIVHAVCGTRTH
jgi:hypothetical protein